MLYDASYRPSRHDSPVLAGHSHSAFARFLAGMPKPRLSTTPGQGPPDSPGRACRQHRRHQRRRRCLAPRRPHHQLRRRRSHGHRRSRRPPRRHRPPVAPDPGVATQHYQLRIVELIASRRRGAARSVAAAGVKALVRRASQNRMMSTRPSRRPQRALMRGNGACHSAGYSSLGLLIPGSVGPVSRWQRLAVRFPGLRPSWLLVPVWPYGLRDGGMQVSGADLGVFRRWRVRVSL